MVLACDCAPLERAGDDADALVVPLATVACVCSGILDRSTRACSRGGLLRTNLGKPRGFVFLTVDNFIAFSVWIRSLLPPRRVQYRY